MQVNLVDYGVGNTLSIVRAFERLNIRCDIVKTPAELVGPHPMILGGVGCFDDAMQKLKSSGMKDAMLEAVAGRGVPILGICLGMHLLTRGSEEGSCEGLSLLDAVTIRFDFKAHSSGHHLPVPHIGWNTVNRYGAISLPAMIPEEGGEYYFNHSYHINAINGADFMVTDYGYSFCSAVQKGSIFGVQFHPEKSRRAGAGLLKRFAGYPHHP